jgi:hypothetical protein
LDVEAIFEDAVQDGGADAVIVVGLGRDIQGPGTEVLAAGATRAIFGIVDVGVGHLLVSQRMNTTVERAFAAAAFAAGGTGVGLGGATDDANERYEHGLCSWGYGSNVPLP